MKDKSFRLLLADMAVSTFASTFGTFVISWIAFEITGSKVAMGSLWFISITAQIIVQFLIGPYIDRWARTKAMKISEFVRLIAFSLILILDFLGMITIEFLYIATFFTSIVIYDPAANALIPRIVKKEALVKANAKISGIIQLIRFITLPIAGILVEVLGNRNSLIMIVSMFLGSFCLLTLINEKHAFKKMQKASWLNRFKKGLGVYKKHKILLLLGIFICTTSFGVFATQAMYIPFVTEILGGTSFEYGLFMASFPLGYIIGARIVGWIPEPKRSLYIVMITALFFGGLTYIMLGLTHTLWVALLIEASAGVAMPFWNIYSSTLYQRIVPDSLLGQVFSVRFILTKAATPIGIVYGTFFATVFNLSFLFLSVGLIICIISGIGLVLMLLSPINRKSTLNKGNSLEM